MELRVAYGENQRSLAEGKSKSNKYNFCPNGTPFLL